MKEAFDWAGILGKPSYSPQNKFNFFLPILSFLRELWPIFEQK